MHRVKLLLADLCDVGLDVFLLVVGAERAVRLALIDFLEDCEALLLMHHYVLHCVFSHIAVIREVSLFRNVNQITDKLLDYFVDISCSIAVLVELLQDDLLAPVDVNVLLDRGASVLEQLLLLKDGQDALTTCLDVEV